MNIVWSPEAIEDLRALRVYVAKDNPAAARRMAERILACIEGLLSENPQIGRGGRVPGTRELVVPQTPYIVPYRVQHETVQILRVFHCARRWPETF